MDSTGLQLQPSLSSNFRLTSVVNHISSASRFKVVVCRDLGPEVMGILRNRKELDLVIWPEDSACKRSWLLENISGSVGIIVMLSDIVNEELLDAAGPSLKVVSTMSVGYEHVDISALSRRNIKLGYTPDVLTDAVADLGILLALMASRNVKESTSTVQNSQWPTCGWGPFGFCGPQLSASVTAPGRTAGFFGFGRIAQATLARLIPFGITQCLYTASPSSRVDSARDAAIAKKLGMPHGSLRRVDRTELTRESDVLFVLAPGGANTYHVVNEEFLKSMKKTAILVNPSRGTLIDSDALAKALREGWIWGAGLDVVEGEPNIDANHPLVKEPRCVVLPHIGSATTETRLAMATLTAQNVIAGVLGDKLPTELNLSGRV